MTRAAIKAISALISEAENEVWYDCRSLVRLLSFALKLRELAYPALFENRNGRKAARKIGLLLLPLVGDPARVVLNVQPTPALTEASWWHLQKARRDAYSDAESINAYVLKLLNLYGVTSQVDRAMTGMLSPGETPTGISTEEVSTWWEWAYDYFFPVPW
jgi:hypothetical protein